MLKTLRNAALMLLMVLMSVSAHAADTFGSFKFYYGDMHAHTGASNDGCSSDFGPTANRRTACGAFADVDDIAIANGLDWVVFSDHTNGNKAISDAAGGDGYWRDTVDKAFAVSTSTFLAFPGAEIAVTVSPGSVTKGHKTLVFFGSETELTSVTRNDASPTGTTSTDVSGCNIINTWMGGLNTSYGPSLLFPHHIGATSPMATVWGCMQTTYEVGVETYSHWGGSRTWQSTSLPWSDYDPIKYADGTTKTTKSGVLQFGLYTQPTYRVGILSGTDNHDTEPGKVCKASATTNPKYMGGVTVAMLDETATFDRDTMYEAFLDGRVYMTTGPHIPIKMTVWDSTGTTELGKLGNEIDIPGSTSVMVKIEVPTGSGGGTNWADDVASVEIIQKGATNVAETPTTLTETSPGSGVYTGIITGVPAGTASGDAGYAYFLMTLTGTDAHPSGCYDEWSTTPNDNEEAMGMVYFI